MSLWRKIHHCVSFVVIVGILIYLVYFTTELHTRFQNIRKYERLQQYEREIEDLTVMLNNYKKEAESVEKSLKILNNAFSSIIVRKPVDHRKQLINR